MNTRKPQFNHYQSGVTIIEVMVAIFVLAFGVLAVISSQLRSIRSVEEAGSQAQVANIVQNLIENMQLNPFVELGDHPRKKYTNACSGICLVTPNTANNEVNYALPNVVRPRTCSENNLCKNINNLTNKRQLQQDHIGRFEDALVGSLPPGSLIAYTICHSKDIDMVAAGTIQYQPGGNNLVPGSVTDNCSNNANDQLFVKVIWQPRQEANHVIPITYTYTASVPTH